ncbi:hypothetical protein CTAYLR_007085 [Chrysophaeum taylorii]|uniref:WW domain-containing protein n=1 Tax=Chrysophaeum taylorii TaxID=2483200 RepID=A0AAD7XLT3_9STRA|nr:hypothetical protein CTAYLR_007085 [Chrysophaeum taylorii]
MPTTFFSTLESSVAPSMCREYCVLVNNDEKRCKVPWYLPGSYWIWCSEPCVKLGATRIDLDDASARCKIPITFCKSARKKRQSVDVHVSVAPPEFFNARRYVLRFHLTLCGTEKSSDDKKTLTPPLEGRREQAVPPPPAEPIEIAQLENIVKTERLMQLHAQCQELRRYGCPSAWRLLSTVVHPEVADDVRRLESISANFDNLNKILGSQVRAKTTKRHKAKSFRDGLSPRASKDGSRPSSPVVEMAHGWSASFDATYKCPYYFHEKLGVVQWEPPDEQEPVRVCHGSDPVLITRPGSPEERTSMLESPISS